MKLTRFIIILVALLCGFVTLAQPAHADIIDRWVGAIENDAEESGAWTDITINDLEFGDKLCGVRFPDVQIPKGATIASAYIKFTPHSSSSGLTTTTIYGEAHDNGLPFVEGWAGNISPRDKTSASVTWSIPSWTYDMVANKIKQWTPDLSPIVQEIVNRANWQAGNSMVFIFNDDYGERIALAHQLAAGQGHPEWAGELHVEFTVGAAYTIAASATTGGSISPVGTVSVNQGDDKTFTITPDTGYAIADVVVDGVSQGAVSSYTFSSVTVNHTITASFSPVPTYTITASAGNNGSIAPSGDVVVNEHDDQGFTITPDLGYSIDEVLVDGVPVGAVSTYTFSNVTADHTIEASFVEGGAYTIIAVAGNGGSISPSGGITVTAGGNQTFTITPDAGKSVLDVEVDGVSVGAVTTRTFSSVSSGHVIVAYFVLTCDECVDVASVPLGSLIHAAPPNIMIVLDDSGSMDAEILTTQADQGTFSTDGLKHWYVFDDPGDHNYTDSGIYILQGEHRAYWKTQWSGYNKMYYNPSIDYGPWPGLGDADMDNPRSHPYYDENYFNLNATYWVPGERVIDNEDSDFSETAPWDYNNWHSEAYRASFYETNPVLSEHTATWDPDPNLTAGWYDVYAWWRDTDTYSTSVQYTIYHDDEPGDEEDETASVYVNQRQDSMQWNRLGSTSYWFGGHDTNKVQLVHTPSDGNNHACADAVRFVPAGSSAIQVKNAHYYTYVDTNTNGDYDAGEPVYLVMIEGQGGEAGTYEIKYYEATITGSGEYEMDTDLTEVSVASVPDSVKCTRTAAEERQNFANWYSYHRRRWMAAVDAVANLILSMQGVRIGLYSIQQATIQPVLKVKVEGIDQTDQLLDIIFSKRTYNGSTPLRRGLEAVGRYYHQNDGQTGGIGSSPYDTQENGGECQQAFAILMTDGYWNGGDPLNAMEIKNVDGDNGVPYADTYAKTLADVAMYYYENDLSSGLGDKVPTNPADDATHQHMVTYSVAFGVSGNLNPDDYDEDLKHKQTGVPVTWPDVYNDWEGPSKIDDVWHAAVNGRGSFLSAHNPEELVSSLREIMKSIESRIASASSVSVSGDQLYGTVGNDILMFQATYNPDGWSGDVRSFQVDTGTGEVIREPYIWSAAKKLNERTWTSRNIATYSPDNGMGVPFVYDQLDSSQKAQLNNDSMVVDFLRGNRSTEIQYGGSFRNRFSALGDIVHSSAVFEDGYLYAGANDGMLHCFDASTGAEQFAYAPNLVFGKLAELTNPAYGISHNYYVDQSPTIQPDVEKSGDTTITLLVGGLAGGGKGYYGLDISDPSAMISDDLVADRVLWEFGGDSDLGFTYPRVTIVNSNDPNANSEGTGWIVITGNGYNSQNGNAVLLILDPFDGSVITKLDVGNGPCNGMSTPAAVDADTDGKVDYVYAGDLKGNLWKFDLTHANRLQWEVAYKEGLNPKPFFRCPGQPITTQPDVMVHCEKHGYTVVFGTGKYIEDDDPADTSQQSIFGVWDFGDDYDDSEYLGTFIRRATPELSNQPGTVTLVRQTIVPSTEADPNFWTFGDNRLRILTDNLPDWTTTSELADHTCGEGLGEAGCDPNGVGANPDPLRSAGWYFDLPISGERVTSDPLIRELKVIVISFIAENDPCGAGGDSIIHEIDVCSGGRPSVPQFDIDDSGNIGSGDRINIGTAEDPVWIAPTGIMREGRLQPPAILRLRNPEDEEMKYFSSSTGNIDTEQGPAVGLGVSHWREYR